MAEPIEVNIVDALILYMDPKMCASFNFCYVFEITMQILQNQPTVMVVM